VVYQTTFTDGHAAYTAQPMSTLSDLVKVSIACPSLAQSRTDGLAEQSRPYSRSGRLSAATELAPRIEDCTYGKDEPQHY
jgi:hypothetical protein